MEQDITEHKVCKNKTYKEEHKARVEQARQEGRPAPKQGKAPLVYSQKVTKRAIGRILIAF